MMVRRRRGPPAWGWLAGFGVVMLLGWLATLIFKPEPGLLDHASRLADASTWTPTFGGYFWQNDQSVLTFRKEFHGVHAVSVDLRTGVETPQVKLSDDLLTSGGNVVSWRLSRDGHYLLWCDETVSPSRWNISELAGRRIRSWRQHSSVIYPMWLADSQRWLEGFSGTADSVIRPVVRSIDGKAFKGAQIRGPNNWAMGITPDDRVVSLTSTQNDGATPGTLIWYCYSLSAKPAPVERHTVSMPPWADRLIEAELSPQGDRIACLIQYHYLSPLDRMLARFFPDKIETHTKVGLWIVQRDGSSTHRIGSEEGEYPFGLLWSPDGKRLSFVDHHTLYAVRTD